MDAEVTNTVWTSARLQKPYSFTLGSRLLPQQSPLLNTKEPPVTRRAHAQLLSRVDCLRPHDLSPPGSSVHGIIQAGILERVIISCSRGSSWLRGQTMSPAASALAGGLFTTEPPRKTRDSGPYLINAMRQMHKLQKSTEQSVGNSGSKQHENMLICLGWPWEERKLQLMLEKINVLIKKD